MDHSHVIQFIIGKLLSLFQFGKLSYYGCVYTYTPALLSLPPTLPSHVSRLVQAPRWAPCAMQQLPTSGLFHTRSSNSCMVYVRVCWFCVTCCMLCMLSVICQGVRQCFSLSCPTHSFPHYVQVHSLCLLLSTCLADSLICTILKDFTYMC